MNFILRVFPEWAKSYELEDALKMIVDNVYGRSLRDKVYMIDFMVLFILCTKITFKQKAELLFELLQGTQITFTDQDSKGFF